MSARIGWAMVIVGLALVTLAGVVAHRFGDDAREPPAVVAPMPNAWQVLIVPPGHGNPSNIVAFGATVGDALRAAAENGTDYRRDYSPWIAGDTCTGDGVRRTCNAVRNPRGEP